MVCIFLADGFEMIEALTPCDILHRAGLDVRLASVSGKEFVRSTHGVDVKTDLPLCNLDPDAVDMMILPGGMPGAKNLYESKPLIELLMRHAEQNKPIGAICAAPFILGKRCHTDRHHCDRKHQTKQTLHIPLPPWQYPDLRLRRTIPRCIRRLSPLL